MKTICPSHLLHFAWYTTPGNRYWSAQENIQWLQAGLTLVQEFSAGGGQRMVGAGTCAEYDWRYGYCSEDITPLKPQSLYGISKHSLHVLHRNPEELQISVMHGAEFSFSMVLMRISRD